MSAHMVAVMYRSECMHVADSEEEDVEGHTNLWIAGGHPLNKLDLFLAQMCRDVQGW